MCKSIFGRGDILESESDNILCLIQKGQKFLKDKAPDVMDNFQALSQSVTKEGQFSPKYKEIIAVAIAVSIRCQPCIVNHVKRALEAGATAEEIMESCSVAVMMGGGPAIAYTSYVVQSLKDFGALK